MKIERYTELMVAKKMGLNLFVDKKYKFGQVYMQGEKTGIRNIDKALKEAGGKPSNCRLWEENKETTGKAQPEYIITFDDRPDTLIVVECKNSTNRHESNRLNNPKGYAVDGVLYYAKYLKKYFNTIAIAVSGTDEENCEITCFLWEKKKASPVYVPDMRYEIEPPENYLDAIQDQLFVEIV